MIPAEDCICNPMPRSKPSTDASPEKGGTRVAKKLTIRERLSACLKLVGGAVVKAVLFKLAEWALELLA
jgi:hypothetical protein